MSVHNIDEARDRRRDEDDELREARAQAWAEGRSLGPWGQGLPVDECERIEARMLEIVAEEQAR